MLRVLSVRVSSPVLLSLRDRCKVHLRPRVQVVQKRKRSTVIYMYKSSILYVVKPPGTGQTMCVSCVYINLSR